MTPVRGDGGTQALAAVVAATRDHRMTFPIQARVSLTSPHQPEPEVFEVRAETTLAEGDDVVVRGWYHGTHRESGRSFRARFVHWWTVRDGLVTAFEQLCDTALVVAALPGSNR